MNLPHHSIGEFVSVGDRRIHVRGDGDPNTKPVVLLHGFAGSLHWYDRVAALLAQRFRPIRLDLLGHGRTGGGGDLDAPAQGRMVTRLLDRLGVEDVAVVGHSFGADVALSAAEQSGRVREVILVDQAPDYSYARFPPGDALLAHPRLGPVLHRLALPPFVRLGLRFGVAPGFDVGTGFDNPDQPVLDYRAMNPAVAGVVIIDRRHRLRIRPLDAQVRAVGLPTLVIHGTEDRLYDWRRTAERYRAAGARAEIISGAGHSPNIERPGEVAAAIDAFLRDTAAAGLPA